MSEKDPRAGKFPVDPLAPRPLFSPAMKALLGSLLCYVLFASECFAISGGPPYPGGTISPAGTYAGVLQAEFDPTDPFSTNTVGVFTVGIPTTGPSTGLFLIFSRGREFGGSIQGVTDPTRGELKALLNATFNTNVFFPSSGLTRLITSTVTGPLTAQITNNGNVFSQSSALLRGSATVFIENGFLQGSLDPVIDGTLILDVMGFKQSSTPPAAGTLTPPTGT